MMIKIFLQRVNLFAHIFAAVFILSTALAMPAQAANPSITVNFGAGFPISENNLAPGQAFTRQFTVINNTADPQNLMMRLNGVVNSGIASKISLQIKKQDSTFSILPNSTDTELLSDIYAYNDAFAFDQLSGAVGSVQTYTLIFKFDTNAGNEYQNQQTVLDTSVGIDAVSIISTSSRGRRSNGGGGHGNGNNGNASVSAAVGGVSGRQDGANGGQVLGEETAGQQQNEQVAGAESKNNQENGIKINGLSWWIWVVGVLSLLILFWLGRRSYFKKA
jgi:hypothetical protein